ncbi:hypothetical protein CRG98_005208 [Punica granatum]|uniref:GDSL esterase/lipase At4g16230-like n=1 Tax=Punica granatum TaxID=22663 RepID=A0A2I0L156_PUNGR|nr:hypothetical protein CRG98_005208 [Punica granatum]
MAKLCSSCNLLLLVPLLFISALGALQYSGANSDQTPVFFIFGDSTFDVGTNNNLLNSGAKSNFPYNGIDFANSTPTGRFSNGFNTADQIVRLFGYEKSPQPYLTLVQDPSTFKTNILHGVNFASGGAGILDATGNQTYGEVVSMGQQVQQFQLVQGNITEVLGPDAAAHFLCKSLFLISIGSNDIFDHYRYNRDTNLFNLGARKFGIVSIPPIGCCPYARLQNTTTTGGLPGCLTELNDDAQAFQLMVASLLEGLKYELNHEFKYSLGDVYTMTNIMLGNPGKFGGFKDAVMACCGKGQLNAKKPCNISENPNLCPNRSEYVFWDMFHPTEHAAGLVAETLYDGFSPIVVPMNFSQLAQI